MLTQSALATELAACLTHLGNVVEYAERYADLASEPAGGGCRRAVQLANDFLDRRRPLRPVPASVSASAAALIGQPDTRRWRVDGRIFSTSEVLLANAHSPAVIAWVHTAREGDRFHGGVAECICLGSTSYPRHIAAAKGPQ